MKKTHIALGTSVVVLAAFIGFVISTRESPAERQATRLAAVNQVKSAAAKDILPILEQMESDYVVRSYVGNSFPFIRIVRERRVRIVDICDMTENAMLGFFGASSLNPEQTAILSSLIQFADKLRTICPSEEVALRERMIDAKFLVNDHDGAAALIELGLPGKSPNWIKGVVAKIRAHKAYDAQNWSEALKQFTLFGESVAAEPADADTNCDPATGVAYCNSWIIAKNHMRLAEINGKLGNVESQAKEIELARAAYQKALKDSAYEDDPKSLQVLKAEINSLGL